MNKTQYNSIIYGTVEQESNSQGLELLRKICDNMGVALPHGDCAAILTTLKTNNYMGWRRCSITEAKQAVNNGTATIAISENNIAIIAAENNDLSTVENNGIIMTTDEVTPALEVVGMEFYTYSYATIEQELYLAEETASVMSLRSAYVPVTSVEVCPTMLTMNVGSDYQLYEIVSPSNATNQSLVWCSDNEDIVVVDHESGLIYAKAPGIATITATASNGECDSCVVTVKESVTIKKDGYYFNIQFSDGLIWKYLGEEIKYEEYLIPKIVLERSAYNKKNTYSIKQLAFLYLFDPLGVAYYMKYYGINSHMELHDILFFKDKLYKEIFGVKPRFFRTFSSGGVLYYDNSDPVDGEFRKDVYSDAEILFGSHLIIDPMFFTQLAIDLFSMLPGTSAIIDTVEFIYALFFSGSIVGEMSELASEFLKIYFKNNKNDIDFGVSSIFGWSNALLTVLNSLDYIQERFSPPNLEDITIYNKVNNQSFNTYFQIDDGSEISLEEILQNISTI